MYNYFYWVVYGGLFVLFYKEHKPDFICVLQKVKFLCDNLYRVILCSFFLLNPMWEY